MNTIMENRESFQKRLLGLSETDRMLVDFAYDMAKESHRPQLRDSGERYFEHTRYVALILIDEYKITEPDLVISALLHDSIEDSGMFADATKAYSAWRAVAEFRIGRVFNERVARMLIALTKPKVDGEEIKTKEESLATYYHNLERSAADVLLIKMCDRLHNLRSLPSTTMEKRERILRETEEVYYPLFEKALVLPEYQTERKTLLEEIKKTVALLI